MSELHEKERLRFYKSLIDKLEELRTAIDRNTESHQVKVQVPKKKENKNV